MQKREFYSFKRILTFKRLESSKNRYFLENGDFVSNMKLLPSVKNNKPTISLILIQIKQTNKLLSNKKA